MNAPTVQAFLAANGSTILIAALVFAVILFALLRTIRGWRRGSCSCPSCRAPCCRPAPRPRPRRP